MSERAPSDDSDRLSDDELLESLRERDRRRGDALDILFRRHHAKVYRWCLKILGDPMEAEDVTQAIFVDLWEKPSPYQGERRFGAWLYVLTRNRCLNVLRTASRRHESEEWDDDLGEALAARSDPHDEVERAQIDSRVREVCRERLQPVEQNVITLRYTWGLKVDEITSHLGLTNASGARTHLRSAEEKLRRHLKSLRRETEEP